jgi:hypothetical protein
MTALDPHARRNDPDTSKDAIPAGPQREAIMLILLRAYAKIGEYGWTDSEAMDVVGFGMELDGHRRRCSDLRAVGWIATKRLPNGTPQTRVSHHSGRARQVSAITLAGWIRLARP